MTFGRISQDINALNAFFGQVFPMLTNVLGEAGNKGNGDNYDADSGSGSGSGSSSSVDGKAMIAKRRASLMAETESVDEEFRS